MKVRYGFVANSSSSSFVLISKDELPLSPAVIDKILHLNWECPVTEGEHQFKELLYDRIIGLLREYARMSLEPIDIKGINKELENFEWCKGTHRERLEVLKYAYENNFKYIATGRWEGYGAGGSELTDMLAHWNANLKSEDETVWYYNDNKW